MDQLDEQSFLDELMSLRREEAPAPAPAPTPWQAYPGSAMMTTSELLYYGGEDVAEASSSMDLAGPSCDGVVLGPGVVHGAGQALAQEPLHDAMAEDDPSGGNLHRGGGSPSSPVPFIFGAGGAGESSEMTRGVFSGAHPRSKLNGGTTSKNLMAERRRRKRLNDRLSMLRSIVPKIIKEEGGSRVTSTDEIKQALFKSAGYGGRCL
ncbi:hypothetical protein VPH35_086778 [Triticum aestivum]